MEKLTYIYNSNITDIPKFESTKSDNYTYLVTQHTPKKEVVEYSVPDRRN